MQRPLTISLALITALALALPARAATPTEITALSATASGSTVSVSGKVTYGGEDPFLVGQDGTGDNLGGAAGGAVGLDLQRLFISQPGANQNLLFTIDVGSLTGGGVPQAFQYNWDVAVDGGADAGGGNWSIKAMAAGTGSSGDTEPYAAIYSCVPDPDSPTGGFTCSEVQRLTVAFDAEAGEIRITVPASAIGAKSGSTIDAWARNGQPVWVRTSAAGALTGFVTADDMTHDTYTMPVRLTELAVVPAGTPEADVAYTRTVTPSANGSFSASFPGTASGAYDVWARACSAGACTTGSAPVTVG